MEVGYMTNGFGDLVGTGGGVTSAKEIRYLSLIEEADVFEKIAESGYQFIEMFDGNLDKFKNNEDELVDLLEKYQLKLLGVYVGGHYIYEDMFEDELYHIEETLKLAQKFGVKHLVIGGGSVRAKGNTLDDLKIMAKNIDKIAAVAKKYGLMPSYHPHLGSAVEGPTEIETLFSLTEIDFCPDIAHLYAGGSDPLSLIKKYYDRINYVHLKDCKSGEFMPLGAGEINLEEIINYLLEKGYTGDWLIEIDGFVGSPVLACRDSLKYLKNFLSN